MNDDLRKSLKGISTLEADFNGYGCAIIPKSVIETAARFIDLMPEYRLEVSLLPTGRESVQFEYVTKEDVYFEVEIFENEIVFYTDTACPDEGLTVDLETAVQKFLNKEPT